MKLVFLMSSLILTVSAAVADSPNEEPDDITSIKTTSVLSEKEHLENVLFHNPDGKPIAIQDIYVLEIEEDICFDFDTSQYLPKDFNPLKGKHDLDWNKIELIELEEELDLGSTTQEYLPENFNPYKGMSENYGCNK